MADQGPHLHFLVTVDLKILLQVNSRSLEVSTSVFAPPPLLGEDHETSPFADDFSSRRMERDLQILDLPERKLISEWESCVNNAMEAKIALENELSKAAQTHVGNIWTV